MKLRNLKKQITLNDLVDPNSSFRKKMLKEWKEWLDYKERNKKTV